MERYIVFKHCSKCGNTYIHIYEKEAVVYLPSADVKKNPPIVFFYTFCLYCMPLNVNSGEKGYYKTNKENWDAFVAMVCN